MPQLRIISLECVEKQDKLGKDEVVLRVDVKKGPTRHGPFTMGRGDLVRLGFDDDFTKEIDVSLGELDGQFGGGNDDNLGKITVKAKQAGAGILTEVFDKRKGTVYHIKYRVS